MVLVLPVNAPGALAAAVSAIAAGQLVAVPTETVYGIACALDEAALTRLVEAKARPQDKGITLLVDGVTQADAVGRLSPSARRLAEHFWPGPLTLVVPVVEGQALPDLVTGGGAEVGLRAPDQVVARALASACGPLPLTSANRSGEPEARSAAEVVATLGASVAVVLDGGPSPGGVPSTVVAVSETGGGGSWRILRAGALSAAEIEAALEA